MLMASQLKKSEYHFKRAVFARHDTHATKGGFDITLTQKPLPLFLPLHFVEGGLKG